MKILGFEFETFREKKVRKNKEYYERERIKRDESNKIEQIELDNRFERELIWEAESMFNEWFYAQGWLMDFTRRIFIRYVADDKYSRFNTQEKINEFRNNHFNKLKEEAISKTKYPEWFDEYYKQHTEKYKDNPYVHDEWFVLWHGITKIMNNAERELVRRKHFNK